MCPIGLLCQEKVKQKTTTTTHSQTCTCTTTENVEVATSEIFPKQKRMRGEKSKYQRNWLVLRFYVYGVIT